MIKLYNMSWFILAILSVFFFSGANLVQRKLMKNQNSQPVAYMIVFQFLASLLVLIYMLVKDLSFPNLTSLLPNFLFNGVTVAIGSLMMFKALQSVEASEFSILSTSSAFWILLTSAVFLHELVTIEKIIGTILIILGIIVVTWRQKKQKLVLHKGHLYALISATAFGVVFANEAYIVSQIGVAPDLAINFFLPGIVVLLFRPKVVKDMVALLTRINFLGIFSFTLFYLLGAITIFSAYSFGGDASKIYPISKLSVIVTVILAAILLKERGHLWQKIAGSLAAFAGLWFLQ